MSRARLHYAGRRHADPVPGAPALALRGVGVRYPGTARPALADVDLAVPAGGRVALLGPNGSGKSTLLKAIAGLVPVAAGEVRVSGNPVGACHHRVAYLAQRGEVDWAFPMTVRRLVLTGRYPHLGWFRRPARADRRIADDALGRVGLSEVAERQIGRLSGGQRQRVLIARALAQRAEILLLDEPLAALDTGARDLVLALLDDLHAEGRTLVVATHDVAALRPDEVALRLAEGRIAADPEPLPAEAAAWAG